jgi:hypothetical protein
MTDLSQFNTRPKSENGVPLILKHPVSQRELDATLIIRGKDAESYQRAILKINRDALNLATQESDPLLMCAQILAAAIVGWHGIALGEETLDYTPENAVRLLMDYPWIAEQVETGITNRALFITG